MVWTGVLEHHGSVGVYTVSTEALDQDGLGLAVSMLTTVDISALQNTEVLELMSRL